jgi:hypothetical protein
MGIKLNSAAGKLVVAHLAKQHGGAREPKAKKPAKAKAGAKSVRTGGPMGWRFTLTVPVRVVSEANKREFWAAANRRKKQQQEAVRDLWALTVLPMWGGNWNVTGPVNVLLTHIGPPMDGDNLQRAFKGVRDVAADLIGIDDGDTARVQWHYAQRSEGKPGIEITLWAQL